MAARTEGTFRCQWPACHYSPTFYNTQLLNRGIPQPTRLLDLFRDPGLRTMVREGRFVSLLENERLNTVLRFRNTEEKMRYIL